jgi:hypothetical protein
MAMKVPSGVEVLILEKICQRTTLYKRVSSRVEKDHEPRTSRKTSPERERGVEPYPLLTARGS